MNDLLTLVLVQGVHIDLFSNRVDVLAHNVEQFFDTLRLLTVVQTVSMDRVTILEFSSVPLVGAVQDVLKHFNDYVFQFPLKILYHQVKLSFYYLRIGVVKRLFVVMLNLDCIV